VERVAATIETVPSGGRLVLLGTEVDLRKLLALGLAAAGETRSALAQLEKTLPLLQQLDSSPLWRDGARVGRATLAYAYDSVGRQANQRGDVETALAALERAVELHRESGPQRTTLEFARNHAPFLENLAAAARERNDWQRARQALRGIPEIFEGTDYLAYRPDRQRVVNAWCTLADVDGLERRPELARESLDRVGAILATLAALPAGTLALGELELDRAQLEWRLSLLEEAAGRAAEAWSHLETSCRLGGELVRLDPTSVTYRYQQLICLDRLARLASRAGWSDKVANTLAEAKEAWRAYPTPGGLVNDPQVAFLLPRLGFPAAP
jgi:tetratricopeptide (TPR) repeat protein